MWPNIADFSRMLNSPEAAFRDPALKRCAIEFNESGLARAWSGQFATVYRATLEDGTTRAVRTFNRTAPERRERYEAISRHLAGLSTSILVPCKYEEEGIRSASDAQWYPLVTMPWVDGQGLSAWLREKCDAGDDQAISRLADKWVDVVNELRRLRIAHGDLQHGNILISPAEDIVLVDYDGMCVPRLAGRRNLEYGLPDYQHPSRNADTELSIELDNFSALVILTTLLALAHDPGWWQLRDHANQLEGILFRSADWTQPDSSSLIKEIRQCGDAALKHLVEILLHAAASRMEEVPGLDIVWDQARTARWRSGLDESLYLALSQARRLSIVVGRIPELQGRLDELPSLLSGFCSLAPASVPVQIAVLGSPQWFAPDEFTRQINELTTDRDRRGSLLGPSFSQRDELSAEEVVVVLHAGEIFDWDDWQSTEVPYNLFILNGRHDAA